MLRKLSLIAVLLLGPVSGFSQTSPLALDFRPPDLEPRDVCTARSTRNGVDDRTSEGTDRALTDTDRIRYIRSDIRNYMNEDADGFFDFVDALIVRQSEIDATFTPVNAIFARIDLMLRADRVDQLSSEGLLESLRAQMSSLTNSEQIELARFYAEGIGVEQDTAFAQELILEAAYGGNALALLEIARMAQTGTLVQGWDAPLDLTITMGFGGLLGALDGGVCGRAERIAHEYIKGEMIEANPALALAWYRFAADMGGARAAWRVVEFHLNADSDIKDNLELRRYLTQAVRLGVAVDGAARASLVNSGAVTQEALETILGFNHSQDRNRTSESISELLQLTVNVDGMEPDEDGLLLDYLLEVVEMPEAPGRVFDRLAAETLVRKGRWAGEAVAMTLLEEAVARGDANAQLRLAGMLVRYRDDPAAIARAENLLMEAVARHARADAMHNLDSLYRCQVNDAPRLHQANPWAEAYHATHQATVQISPTDLLALSLDRSPEAIAHIQSLALEGRTQMVASQAQRVQSGRQTADGALRYWAQALNRSDRALEAFAEMEFDLASSPAERDLAIELFRRVYLNNGVTTALDLAIALVEYDARNPAVADEIEGLLTMAGNRGEGAAIRLLSRVQAGVRTEAEVYAQFADKIEARGDFLALMFAMPHITADRTDDYIDRAVSLMSCGTKDADELGDAYALHADAQMSFHWRRIGLHFEGGHVLSKLRLTNRQVEMFDDGKAADPVARASRALAEGEAGALMHLVRLTSDPDLSTYDPVAAGPYFLDAIAAAEPESLTQLSVVYRSATPEVRQIIDAGTDFDLLLEQAARNGDVDAAYALGLNLRDTARNAAQLGQSLDWLETAASRGHRNAMFETGYALGLGLGSLPAPQDAVRWLDQAASAGHPQAAELARTLRIAGGF